jgi:hypothetical protein
VLTEIIQILQMHFERCLGIPTRLAILNDIEIIPKGSFVLEKYNQLDGWYGVCFIPIYRLLE